MLTLNSPPSLELTRQPKVNSGNIKPIPLTEGANALCYADINRTDAL
ncbi:hypothetical protein L1D22_11660 [Vibrio sp. Isolate34]|nr:hypothetical protein [Vibrio sp. Isolate34]MCG9640546.1 hypothetical protein [Vibrio sp. Isolate34]